LSNTVVSKVTLLDLVTNAVIVWQRLRRGGEVE
jgi:hypothetical protein